MKDKIQALLKRKSVRVGLGILLAFLILWGFFKPKAMVAETAIIERRTYEQVVNDEGYTRVRDVFTIFSPVDGVMRRIEKQAGQTVKKGETLVVFDWDFSRKAKSPVDGTILRILRESAGPISIGTPILEIGNLSNLEIVSEILTKEAIQIHTGNTVRISGWGGDPLGGKVRLVEPSAFTKVSTLGVEEQRVRVLIDFTPPKEMGEGFQVQCQIVTENIPNSLIVPTAALFRDGEEWATFKVIAGRARKQKVTVSSRSGAVGRVESGLNEGDEVILYPSEDVAEGTKIK